jgi:hypothetical protein
MPPVLTSLTVRTTILQATDPYVIQMRTQYIYMYTKICVDALMLA